MARFMRCSPCAAALLRQARARIRRGGFDGKSMQAVSVHPPPPHDSYSSRKLAPQHQRRRALRLARKITVAALVGPVRIIAFAAAGRAESRPLIEPICRPIAFIDLEKDRAGAQPGEPAQM